MIPTPSAFTLHIRITHACNAACTYCSSWKQDPDKRMRLPEFEQCLDGVEQFWKCNGIAPDFLNVEYVGGELLLVPHDELAQMVTSLRHRFGNRMTVRDGAQSNLIGSDRRLQELFGLFDGRVGTSVDHFTDQRQLGKDSAAPKRAKAYRTFFMSSSSTLEKLSGRKPGGVLTVDAKSLPFLEQEVALACGQQRDLVIRPVFQGGRSIDRITDRDFGQALTNGFNTWVSSGMLTHIEPYVSLLRRRLEPDRQTGFCAWQKDCGMKSLSIEPNGDVFVCQEMADTKLLMLGNFLDGTFDVGLHQQINQRAEKLNAGCFECEYFKSCQGGCMQQSLEVGNGMYGKTQWCLAWKMLFKAMDDAIAQHGRSRLAARISHLWGGF